MPEETQVAPPPAPAAPETPPVATSTDLPPPTPPPAPGPEDDPNHQLALLIAKRKDKKAKKEGAEAAEPTPEDVEEKAKKQEKLGDLIADALKFKGKKPAPKPDTKVVEPEPEVKAEEPPSPPAPKAEPTLISKRKPDPEPADRARELNQAAAAAATAAVQALQPSFQQQPKQEEDPGEALKPSDRHKYEVAKFLATTDPHYKDAPREIVNQARRAEAYASRWEAANPGKAFKPQDEEHNEFYESESMEEPWTDLEFAKAERAMERAADKAELKKEYEAELAEIRETNARLELTGEVDRRYSQTAGELARALNVHEVISSGGVDKLQQQDPITARVLLETLDGLSPLIEAIVQIDDPKGRIKVDMQNPAHQQWAAVVHEGETRSIGKRDEHGRIFARRADYKLMNQAAQARHWFLTTEHILKGLVEELAPHITSHVKKQRDEQIKIARSLGFIPKEESPAAKNGGADGAVSAPPPPAKPASPTVGGGAKIDATTSPNKTKNDKLMDSLADTLWGR